MMKKKNNNKQMNINLYKNPNSNLKAVQSENYSLKQIVMYNKKVNSIKIIKMLSKMNYKELTFKFKTPSKNDIINIKLKLFYIYFYIIWYIIIFTL